MQPKTPALATALPADRVIRPGHPDYDEARLVWNGMIDHHPAVIAESARTDEVVAAIPLARAEGLPISIRGGGHNVAGLAVGDGSLVVDCAELSRSTIDPGARRARVGGGARWGDVDAAAQAHGLATPGGVVSVTGVAGLTLSAGLGWLRRAPRAVVRRPPLGARRDRGRPHPPRDRRRAPRPALGAAGRRRQLRGRHGARVRAVSGRAGGGLVRGHLPDRGGRPLLARLAWDCGGPARGDVADRRPDARARRRGVPGAGPRPRRAVRPRHRRRVARGWRGDAGADDAPRRRGGGRPGGPTRYADFQQFFDADYPAHTMRYYWKSSFADELSDARIDALSTRSPAARRTTRRSTSGRWAARSRGCRPPTARTGSGTPTGSSARSPTGRIRPTTP